MNIAAERLQGLAVRALVRHGLREPAALQCARMLIAADICGLEAHGVSRVPMYCRMLARGRILGGAEPRLLTADPDAAAVLVDAAGGIGYDACAVAIETLVPRARRHGVAFAGIRRSTHVGALGLHLQALADAGFVALALSGAPAAMPFAGGRKPLLGTNPVAAVFPRRDAEPLLVDMSMTTVARGHILLAAQRGEPIPGDWALDRDGQPTTDAQAALGGSLRPVGGAKGSMLALCFELLCAALTGAAFGFEADAFFAEDGNAPNLGQAFLAIDPARLAGRETYLERVETLVAALSAEPEVRMPGERRAALRAAALRDGVPVADDLVARLEDLAQQSSQELPAPPPISS
jgi:(2R)-3-sulfolactate dehydrogenase (NADP+)